MFIDESEKMSVLVIDDSAFMRVLISDMLKSDSCIKSVDTARNGKEGLEKAILLKPDIITLDIEMPIMNGIDTLAELMKMNPIPRVIMLSSYTFNGAEATIKALELGALDFIEKPRAPILGFDPEQMKNELIGKIKSLCKSKETSCEKTSLTRKQLLKKGKAASRRTNCGLIKNIVAIGTSTGGPKALQEVLTKLPYDIPAALLIVQHMPQGFTKSLSERLNNLSSINVKEAENGDVLKPGWAYIAPGDYHMLINNSGYDEYKISINREPPETGHRPSVNVMMKSVAESGHKSIVAVMMTGMGSDGSDGILKIKEAGGITIAQDEKTSIVYGMPRSAVNNGAIDIIAPLYNIAEEIINNLGV